MLKVNNRKTLEQGVKTIKTPERHHWRRSSVFIVNFEHISHLAIVFLLLTFSRKMPAGLVMLKAFHT